MHRVPVLVGTLGVLALLAPTTAAADTTVKTRCTGEQTNYYNVRVTCEVERVRRNERITFPARPDCDRYRDFWAEATNPDIEAWDGRTVPIPRFRLQEEADYAERSYRLNVRVWANKKRIKFHNRSDMLVDVSWSMRCQV